MSQIKQPKLMQLWQKIACSLLFIVRDQCKEHVCGAFKRKQYNRKPTWHDHLVAALAAVAILSGATLATHYLAIIAGAEWFSGQWLVALGTAETVLMPVAVLMVQLLNTERRLVVSRGALAEFS